MKKFIFVLFCVEIGLFHISLTAQVEKVQSLLMNQETGEALQKRIAQLKKEGLCEHDIIPACLQEFTITQAAEAEVADSETTEKILWFASGAAITTGIIFFITRFFEGIAQEQTQPQPQADRAADEANRLRLRQEIGRVVLPGVPSWMANEGTYNWYLRPHGISDEQWLAERPQGIPERHWRIMGRC